MAITVIERPYEINWSKNPIRYTLQTNTDLTTEGLYLQLSVLFSTFDENDFSEIVVLSLFPDSAGVCEADICNILNGMLDYFIPTVGAGPELAAGQNGKFKIRYREVTDASPENDWQEDVARSVLKGGLSYEKWRGPNFFTTYLPNNKPFLSWQPGGGLCNVAQSLYLFFLQSKDSSGQITAEFKVHYTDGTESPKTVDVGDGTETAAWSIWCIPTGINQNGLNGLQQGKTIYWYEVSVKDNSGVLATAYRYEPDYRFFQNIFSFNYINSLGGLDAIRILGEWEQMQQRTFDTLETYDEKYYQNSRQIEPRNRQANHNEIISYKGNAGFMEDPNALDAYRELMLSPQVMELRDNRWMTVLITNDKTVFGSKKYKPELLSLPVEWQFSFRNKSYTPAEIQIGNAPACPVPTGLHEVSNDGNTSVIGWTAMAGNNSFVIELSGKKSPEDPDGSGPIQVSVYDIDWYISGSTTAATYSIDLTGWVDCYARVKAICSANSSGYTHSLKLI